MLNEAIEDATRRLAEAGVPSPRADAELLAAHLLHVSRSEVVRLALVGGTPTPEGYDDLVGERARRIPLQHLTGRAPFRDLDLAVGPGRLRAAAGDRGRRRRRDRRSPSGLGRARHRPGRRPLRRLGRHRPGPGHRGAGRHGGRRRGQRPGTRLGPGQHRRHRTRSGRAAGRRCHATRRCARQLADLAGRVDVVVSNPPYVPPGQQPVDPEVRDHDPEVALYGGGPDGLAVPRAVIALAGVLLRTGRRVRDGARRRPGGAGRRGAGPADLVGPAGSPRPGRPARATSPPAAAPRPRAREVASAHARQQPGLRLRPDPRHGPGRCVLRPDPRAGHPRTDAVRRGPGRGWYDGADHPGPGAHRAAVHDPGLAGRGSRRRRHGLARRPACSRCATRGWPRTSAGSGPHLAVRGSCGSTTPTATPSR